MAARRELVLDLGRRQLRALEADRDRRLLRVRRTLSQDYPDWLDTSDTETLGQWVAEQLADAGVPRGQVTFALSRERVVLKRLTLPTVDEDELPEMTRLTMQRDLPFSSEGAVIDYIAVDSTETHTTVLAAALPEDALQHTREVAHAAGLKIARITLRGMGAAALLQALDAEGTAAGLVLDVTTEAVEFVLVTDGAVRITRAAEIPQSSSHQQIVHTLITETRRTWMSYRIAEDSAPIDEAVLLGNGELTDEAAREIGSILDVPTRVLRTHPQIDPGTSRMTGIWPLAGTLLESLLSLDEIDFANPRKAADRVADRRRRVIMAGGAVLVVLLSFWTFGRMHLQALDDDIIRLETKYKEATPGFLRYVRDNYRVQHLQQWHAVEPDWLAHLGALTNVAPKPGEVVFDSFSGSLDFRGVRFDRDADAARAWSAPAVVSITVDGEAVDRATADKLREALVESDIYATSSSGADAPGGRRLPFGFTYRLIADAEAAPVSENKSTTEGAPPS